MEKFEIRIPAKKKKTISEKGESGCENYSRSIQHTG